MPADDLLDLVAGAAARAFLMHFGAPMMVRPILSSTQVRMPVCTDFSGTISPFLDRADRTWCRG
jgi:hypothetical protein